MDIQEKARELFAWSAEPRTITECEDFIRSVISEAKPTVSKAFVENKTNRMEQLFLQNTKRADREYFIQVEVLRDAGVEEKS